MKNCENCAHCYLVSEEWNKIRNNECRRYPPVFVIEKIEDGDVKHYEGDRSVESEVMFVAIPDCKLQTWCCGEWKLK